LTLHFVVWQIVIGCLALVLCILPDAAYSLENFAIETCDELVALDAKRFLCIYEKTTTTANWYEAKIYKHGKFYHPEAGKYDARIGFARGTHNFRVEQEGRLLVHEDRAWLMDDRVADFYRTDMDNGIGQKVYICDYANKHTQICNVAPDGEYVTKTGVHFETVGGFLGAACSYEPSWGCSEKAAIICENRD
jgi:hypothetical protein